MKQLSNTVVRLGTTILVVASATFSTAQINVAAAANGGIGTQSSLYATGSSDKGNDGNQDGRWDSQSVMHTQFESGAWYKISFASPTDISQVNVFNRTDSWTERLSPFTVSLSLNGSQVWSASNQTFTQNISGGDPFSSGMSFAMSPVLADSVMVQLDRTEWLHLAELEAISPVPEPTSLAALATGAAVLMKRRKSIVGKKTRT